jgi:hypothetical protein
MVVPPIRRTSVPWTGYAAALIATPGEAIARAAPDGVATM